MKTSPTITTLHFPNGVVMHLDKDGFILNWQEGVFEFLTELKPEPMKPFEGYETLNEDEKKFLLCLEAVNDNSIWGTAIGVAMKQPTVTTVRRLIGDLRSQANDNSEVMLSILGKPCYEQLLNL